LTEQIQLLISENKKFKEFQSQHENCEKEIQFSKDKNNELISEINLSRIELNKLRDEKDNRESEYKMQLSDLENKIKDLTNEMSDIQQKIIEEMNQNADKLNSVKDLSLLNNKMVEELKLKDDELKLKQDELDIITNIRLKLENTIGDQHI